MNRLLDAEIEIGRLNDMLEVCRANQDDRINEMRALTDVIRQMFDIPDDAPLTRSLENWLDRFNEINAQEKS